MYYNPRLRRQGPFEYDWMQDQFGSMSNPSYDASPPVHDADQPDFSAYPTWAHDVMAQVYPRLDQAGKLSNPLVLEAPSEGDYGTDVIPTKHPDCEMPAKPSPRCIQEWAQAEARCAALKGQRKLPGTGRGWGRDWDECVCGHVTMECGGNPVELPGDPPSRPKPQPPPPRRGKRSYFGS